MAVSKCSILPEEWRPKFETLLVYNIELVGRAPT